MILAVKHDMSEGHILIRDDLIFVDGKVSIRHILVSVGNIRVDLVKYIVSRKLCVDVKKNQVLKFSDVYDHDVIFV